MLEKVHNPKEGKGTTRESKKDTKEMENHLQGRHSDMSW